MNKLILFLTLFLVKWSFAQDTINKACYFKNIKEYTTNTPNRIGFIVSESNTDFSFYFQYTKVTMYSKNTWGYINNDGRLYRSIDYIFYYQSSNAKIHIYEAVVDGITKFKVGLGINMYPIDLDENAVLTLIIDNSSLYTKYLSLSKKDRKIEALKYINLYNEEAFASK